MAKNDTVLIDGILDDRVAENLPSSQRDEAFEFFAVEQILRDADLTAEEIQSGCIDGRDDGGIDGFYILVNGHLLVEPESFTWPRSGCELDVWLITCKHHDTFRQAPVDSLVASIGELLDLSLSNLELKGAYSDALLRLRGYLLLAYRKASSRLQRFSIHFAYASRGNSDTVGASIKSRSEQAVNIAKHLFGNCHSTFEFYGAAELISKHRKVRAFSLELPFLEALTRGERYVLLCKLQDYNDFVVDEQQRVRRYLFDSNVRAFMGLNSVNEDIQSTLNNEASPDFWWLNNGVTVLANAATVIGKSIQLEGVQIVNGLQTTESITRYFGHGNNDRNERAVLVKVIVTTDPSIRDAIIRATNNQTQVQVGALHATDKIQRDIEDVLLRDGLFYERRTNFYTGQAHPATLIVTPHYLAAGYVSLILKAPFSAAKLRSRFMRVADAYDQVFSPHTPLKVWPVVARLMKQTDAVLETVRPVKTIANERFLRNWRQLTALIATARVLGKFDFTAGDMISMERSAFTDEIIGSSWGLISEMIGDRFQVLDKVGGRPFEYHICEKAAQMWSLTGVGIVQRAKFPLKPSRPKEKTPVSKVLLDKVNEVLPPQPWKLGMHHVIAKQLGYRSSEVHAAIQELIANGVRYEQRDGVVYGTQGEIIAIDEERLQQNDETSEIDPGRVSE